MEIVLYILGILVALGAGYYFGQNFSAKAKEKNRLESELNDKRQELEELHNRVNNHFETTATLFNQVSDSYQQLYDHMAKSSSQLCSTQNFRATLPISPEVSQPNDKLPEQFDNIHKTNTDANDLFDADNLYNAHDYRNEATDIDVENTAQEPTNEDINDKVIEIDTAKQTNPAKDYATKD
jgi:uncharacterized membrane-anchored protein YhcB (DUF1043 family)